MNTRRLLTLVACLAAAGPAAAQDLSPAVRLSAACAPVGTAVPAGAPRVRQIDPGRKTLYGAGERIAVDAGSNHGLAPGNRYFVRRAMSLPGSQRAEHTVGWVSIVEASATSAIATVDFACDAVAVDDHLEAYVEPTLPQGIEATDATGVPDFATPATVLVGVDQHRTAGGRDFMLANVGHDGGAVPGARYAIYQGGRQPRALDTSIGEAVVVSVFPSAALLRITDARYVISTGGRLVPRRGSTRPSVRSGAAAGLGSAAAATAATPSTPPTDRAGTDTGEPRLDSHDARQSLTFDDVHFGFDQSTLQDRMLPLLDQVASAFKANPQLRVTIEGYSCNIGSAAYNKKLGQRRADFVRTYLVAHGVDASRLTTVSYGEERPKYDNSRKETRKLNRRAALVVDVRP